MAKKVNFAKRPKGREKKRENVSPSIAFNFGANAGTKRRKGHGGGS